MAARLAGPGEAAAASRSRSWASPRNCRPARVARLRSLLEQTQRALTARSAKLPPDGKKAIDGLVDAIEVDLESIFKLALAEGRQPDLQTYLTYADHLRFRHQRDRCLEVIDQALKSPQASRRTATARGDGPAHRGRRDGPGAGRRHRAIRQGRAAHPGAARLPRAAVPGLGHLFAGSIDLDRSGLARELAGADAAARRARQAQPKLRDQRPQPPEDRRRSNCPRSPRPRHGTASPWSSPGSRTWAASTSRTPCDSAASIRSTSSGRPGRSSRPAIPRRPSRSSARCSSRSTRATLPRELEGTLHLLSGEIYQARRSPGRPEEGRRGIRQGARRRPGRDADGHHAAGADRRAARPVRPSPGADRRAAGAGQGKRDGRAARRPDPRGDRARRPRPARGSQTARGKYPRSPELAGLEAALLAKDGKPAEADAVLGRVPRAPSPTTPTLVMMRAQIQAESLKNLDQARALLEGDRRAIRELGPAGPARRLELDREPARRGRGRHRQDPHSLEGSRHRRRARRPARAQARPDGRGHRALRRRPQERPRTTRSSSTGRPSSTARTARSPRPPSRSRPSSATSRSRRSTPARRCSSAAQSALANLSLQTARLRRRDPPVRGAEAEQPERHAHPRRPLAVDHRLRHQGPVAAGQARDRRDPERPQEPAHGRRAGPRRQLLPPAGRETPRRWPSSITCSRSIRPIPSAVVTRSYILLKAKQHDQAAAILRSAIELTAQGRQDEAAGRLLPDAGRRRERDAAGHRRPAASPDGPRRGARASTRGDRAGPGQVPRPGRHGPRHRGARVRRGQGQGGPQGARSAACSSRSYREQKQYDRAEQLPRRAAQGVPRRLEPGRGPGPGRLARGGRGRLAGPARPPAGAQ